MKKLMLVVSALIIMSLLITGCGSNKSSDDKVTNEKDNNKNWNIFCIQRLSAVGC